MIFLCKDQHSLVYTLDEETKELYAAPIYNDNSVNLSEFSLVDPVDEDDELEFHQIKQQLLLMHS